MWLHRLKGSFYALFFIIVNLVYLVIELSFNARLLDVSANLSPDMDYAQLEVYGRTISAAGATILAWRLLVPFRPGLNLLRLVLKFSLIALIVFPLVFVGQKKLIDGLVDKAAAETLRSAEILTLLKYGIANGFVEIEQLAIDDLTMQMAEGKMFITLSGLLAYNASEMREVLETRLDRIAGYAIATEQRFDTRRLYRNYLYAREQVVAHYEAYQQLVNVLEKNQAGSMGEAIRLYESAMNRALGNWRDYQQMLAQQPNLNEVDAEKIKLIRELLEQAEADINACSSHGCFVLGREQLRFALSRQLGFFSELEDWCSRQVDVQAGLVMKCRMQEDGIRSRIIAQRKADIAAHAGLSRPYLSQYDYLTSEDMRSSVFAVLREAGINVDPDWNFHEFDRLLDDISQQFKAIYRAHYDEQVVSRFGVLLPRRSSLDEFNGIERMQAIYRQALDNPSLSTIGQQLSPQDFEDRYVAPVYFAKFNALLSRLRAGEAWYAQDAPYEESGKASLRNLVVPAVAIAFSLVFGLLNSINLLLNFVFLLIEEKLWLRWLGFVSLLLIVLLLPLRQQYQIYGQEAYRDLLVETEREYGYWAHLLDWIARSEPLVYPVGNMLRYNLLDGFEFD
jgi:Fe-S cluster biosynthesis and repair protein YggX